MRFEIFTEWTSPAVNPDTERSDERTPHGTWLSRTGMVVQADTNERAIELAVMRGACAGLGYSVAYVGLVAREMPLDAACDVCGYHDAGNTCCDEIVAPTMHDLSAPVRVRDEDYIEASYPTAYAMLQLWEMPWSHRRLKYATWALHRARRAGCDVLENPRVVESMEIAAAERVS